MVSRHGNFGFWHVLGVVPNEEVSAARTVPLFGRRVVYLCRLDGADTAWMADDQRPIRTQRKYGYLWGSLVDDPNPLFGLPEFEELDRKIIINEPIGVSTSAPRAIENFIDIAHFPFVHTGILGEEPHTEVMDYSVRITAEGELMIDGANAYQPRSAANASTAKDVGYSYRVPHPACCILYKSSPVMPDRCDVIGLFIRPANEERIAVHSFNCLIDALTERRVIRAFNQTIFGQDKPILENQIPKRLPLDPRAETPIRADRGSVAFRRWLAERDLTYGTLPA